MPNREQLISLVDSGEDEKSVDGAEGTRFRGKIITTMEDDTMRLSSACAAAQGAHLCVGVLPLAHDTNGLFSLEHCACADTACGQCCIERCILRHKEDSNSWEIRQHCKTIDIQGSARSRRGERILLCRTLKVIYAGDDA